MLSVVVRYTRPDVDYVKALVTAAWDLPPSGPTHPARPGGIDNGRRQPHSSKGLLGESMGQRGAFRRRAAAAALLCLVEWLVQAGASSLRISVSRDR